MSDVPGELSSERLIQRGKVLKTLGRWDEAVYAFRAAIAQNPDAALSYAHLAECYYHLDRGDEAVIAAEAAIRQAPDSEWGHRLLAIVLAGESRIPYAPKAAILRTRLARLNRRDARALASARRAVALAPEKSVCHATLANIASRAGRLEEARHAAKKAIELDPESAEAHSALGMVELHDADFRAAAASFRRGLEIEPESANLMNNLGIATIGMDRYRPEKGVQYYTSAARLHPEAKTARSNIVGSVPRLRGPLLLLPGIGLAVHPIAGAVAMILLCLQIFLKRRERLKKLDPTAAAYARSTRTRWRRKDWLVGLAFLLGPSAMTYPLGMLLYPKDQLAFRAMSEVWAFGALMIGVSIASATWRKPRDFSVKRGPAAPQRSFQAREHPDRLGRR